MIIVADYKMEFGIKNVTENGAKLLVRTTVICNHYLLMPYNDIAIELKLNRVMGMNMLACGIPCTPAKCLSYWC